ncbi:hypothetical protein HCG51_29740 [Tolypothrix sp. PCC 7910]|uniref:hypothetical protein n=1 Tax=Tolypothrix sp. PCC 7910 TaxID=2099387 RepID=UPI0014278FE2|nr:hypothetical protein [Tolypothrix sp. PCC 7910]QIR40461.1 hypothetical protein HCG51_29740 [Tolypothrix sp. PCC 7910]
MQTKLFWFILGIVLWLSFGAIIGGVGAWIVSYTWVLNVVGYGAVMGSVVGLIVSLVGLAIASQMRSINVMLWVIFGSIVGAIIGFKAVILYGGYPNRTQADLSFVTLAPTGLLIGALLGILLAVGIWKYRHSGIG